jgi:hypothetical protein
MHTVSINLSVLCYKVTFGLLLCWIKVQAYLSISEKFSPFRHDFIQFITYHYSSSQWPFSDACNSWILCDELPRFLSVISRKYWDTSTDA